ncbi:MAG TPA: response regulator, partial [Casimicrobiaceae bacterium]
FSHAKSIAGRAEAFLQPFAGHILTAASELAQFSAGRTAISIDSAESSAVRVRDQPAGVKLLVVDNNGRNREVLSNQLERQGYAVCTASNGREGLDLLRSEPFDIVLLDVRMPELDGFATLGLIQADPLLRDIPVIMISASDEYQSVIRCIEGGAEDYLTKPFDPVLLRARLKACFEKKALRDEQRRRTEELEKAYRDLRGMQDQLLTQQKLASLGSLAAGIAHEIKNPLNFVTNFAALSNELLGELKTAIDAGDKAEAAALLESLGGNLDKIEEHGKRADRIVRGMLMHSRKRGGDRESADLNALLTECVQLAFHGLRSQDMSFNAAIAMHLDPAVGNVEVFPQDLSRVFLNLAANAFYAVNEKRKTSDQGFAPTVTASTRSAGDEEVEVRVRDNGMGIPPAVLGKIFEPFYSTKPSGSGTGLGLSISREIVVQEHHGTLRAETQEGEFAEFIVTLPRHSSSAS